MLPLVRRALRGRNWGQPGSWLGTVLYDEEARYLGTDPVIGRRFLAELDAEDPERVKWAIQTCGLLDVPGAMAKFAELIHSPGIGAFHAPDEDSSTRFGIPPHSRSSPGIGVTASPA